jgi:dolichyl-diphosphooligosaccharide--protein glycosyltransferase
MRKRAQRRGKTPIEEPKHIAKKFPIEKKTITDRKNWWIAVSLIGIFLLVLFLNSYFNITSEVSYNPEGKNLDKFFLSGPDPYYNMRLINVTVESGTYPYYSENDPLLNYPIGSTGARPPLLNMFAIGFSRLLTPVMSETDALGYSMQFIPALFGALIVFPVYYLGKTIFGKKEGLIAAFLIALIPIHIGSGHGSAYSLFDHDSLNLLLFFFSFLFLIKGIKEKDSIKSVLFALLSGLSLAALTMTWTESQFLYVVIGVYAIVQILIDIFTNKMDIRVVRTCSLVLLSGYLISIPIRAAKLGGLRPDIPLYLALGITAFGAIYFLIKRMKVPWTITLPALFCAGGIGLVFLYFIEDITSVIPFLSPLTRISDIIFGAGVYGTKVALTIAEAGTSNISRTIMSFGPALYWLGWIGFIFLIYYYYKEKNRRDYLFLIVLFLVDIWLASTAGRFLNDIVPVIAILSGWIIWMIIDKIDYTQMIRNIRSAGGGFHGLRRGIKVFHLFGILFISFIIIIPNAYLSLDAAIPSVITKNGTSNMKNDFFGEDHSTAFGLSHGKEAYWIDAYNWLNEQDTEIEDVTKRPAFISWWDYGFYEAAVGAHPTVADNFQDGIPPAANFHTSTSEQEAVAIWIIRLLEGNRQDNKGELSDDVVNILEKHLDKNDSINVTNWIEDSSVSPSYNAPIGEEYDEVLSQQYRVGEQYGENAYYHDISDLIVNKLDDEEITWLYHDIQETTGYSIRYYGVEGYDKQIFNIFGFLADKSLLLVAGGDSNPEDDYVKIFFTGYNVNPDGTRGADGEWTATEIAEMSLSERQSIAVTNTRPQYKDAYFDSMFYRTYVGLSEGSSGNKQEINYQLPCFDMKHFHAEFISEYPKYYYYSGKSAVVIAKYYEGAYINGTVKFRDEPIPVQVVVQKNISHYGTNIPIDHDKNNTVNSSYNVIAPAGPINLQIRRNTELGANAFVLKNVTLDGPEDSELAPITEAESMRTPGSNYQRTINITIDEAKIDGYVYLDKDDVEGYNTSIDEPLTNVQIAFHEIYSFTEQGGASSISRGSVTVDENGYYNASGFLPGFYMVRAELDDFIINENLVSLYPGNNSYNISKQKLSTVQGKIYYDSNNNEEYDTGEEMDNANVDIIYKKIAIDGTTVEKEIKVETTQTDANGDYSFTSITPGQYTINTVKDADYGVEKELVVEENATMNFDIQIELLDVLVSGNTKYETNNIANLSILFSQNLSVINNTAVGANAFSNSGGFYEIGLQPGYYNISVDQLVNESGQNVTYTYTGSIELKIGEGTKTFDIILARKES